MTNDGSGSLSTKYIGRACIEVGSVGGSHTSAGGPFLQSGSVTYYGGAAKFVSCLSRFVTFLRGD